jgi:predicted nucleotidyltransferase
MSDAFQVPIIPQRKRIPGEAIQDVVDQIVSRFQPQKIILFGSYAYGTPRPESDLDLLVVMETAQSEARQAAEILQTIEYRFGLDLVIIAETINLRNTLKKIYVIFKVHLVNLM